MLQELSGYTRQLDSLSPAELLFLLNPKNSSSLSLLKISLLDLNVKRIIDFKFVEMKTKQADFSYHSIVYPENSSQEDLKPHEEMILQIIKSIDKSIPTSSYKTILKSNRLKKLFFFNEIYLGLVKQGLMGRTPIFEQMGFFRKTSKGRELAKFMRKFIPYCEEKIDDWIENDVSQLVDLLNKFDTNILISESLYLFWKSIDFFNSLPEKENNRYIKSLSNNYIGEYIRLYCNNQNSLVDYRDIEWHRSGFPLGKPSGNVANSNDIHSQAIDYATTAEYLYDQYDQQL